ncbi:class II D-tagatose-bisphosphate aldolase non-catalytic subunit [Jiella pacifica]|nr:class II D-tagatose-bisphosphate aldolase, non-catalytic subunit [Jiella pacifica]
MMTFRDFDLAEGIRQNRAAGDFAFASICSAHPEVLAAALEHAREGGWPIIVEATSNQVNQFGGYTGMMPGDFIAFVAKIAEAADYPVEKIVFGGDHLGPQAWRSQPAEEAMGHAETMVRSYVEAGFTKIHLDCSEGCRGEPAQLDDAVVAERAARLARACEAAAGDGASKLRYVVGTEVPPPGGARGEHAPIVPTDPDRALQTIEAHRQAFEREGLGQAFGRVCALVVQPGLEFGPAHVDHFDTAQPDRLSQTLEGFPTLAFEAHSTDYQKAAVYPELARRHFAVLKVGPALTHAYREAIYGLSHVDGWLTGSAHISTVMEDLMLAEPKSWSGHYDESDAATAKALRHFGYADRIRYYWAKPAAIEAVAALAARLDAVTSLPRPMLEQYFTAEEVDRALGREGPTSANLVRARIRSALKPYFWPGDARA